MVIHFRQFVYESDHLSKSQKLERRFFIGFRTLRIFLNKNYNLATFEGDERMSACHVINWDRTIQLPGFLIFFTRTNLFFINLKYFLNKNGCSPIDFNVIFPIQSSEFMGKYFEKNCKIKPTIFHFT